MSIPVLIDTFDEVRRLAIGGSVVAPGDFRLKKLIPPLEQSGKKAPVFAKVAEAVSRVVESNGKTSAAALLELTTLVSAILYTQGETGIEGELAPIKTIELGQPKTQASARLLKPLLEALTTTGSGRLEIIRDACQRGAFHDLRLIAPALAALDDTYSEIGDLVAKEILPLYGQAILSELQAQFDPRGRSGHVRRLTLMHRLDPAGTRPFVQRALEEGSKEVRIAAIGCLGDSPDDLPFLLEQVKSKAKDVRTAALNALGASHCDDAVKVLCEAIESADLSLAIEPLRNSRHPTVTGMLLDAAEKLFNGILTSKEKDPKKLGKDNERLGLLLECLRGRDDARTEKLLLHLFARRAELAAVKGEPSGKDLLERLVSLLVAGPAKLQSALVNAHETLPAGCLGQAMLAACRCRKPAEVFALFSPYLTAKVNESKKSRDPAFAKQTVITELLQRRRAWWYYEARDLGDGELNLAALDPQWLDLAVRLGRSDLVQSLAVPGHVQANALLWELLQQGLKKTSDDHELLGILGTMIRVGHPQATDAAIELIKRSASARSAYSYYWIGHLVPRLPKDEAVPKLKALLPTLPEKIVDQLMEVI